MGSNFKMEGLLLIYYERIDPLPCSLSASWHADFCRDSNVIYLRTHDNLPLGLKEHMTILYRYHNIPFQLKEMPLIAQRCKQLHNFSAIPTVYRKLQFHSLAPRAITPAEFVVQRSTIWKQ